jgi:hypothetical protein
MFLFVILFKVKQVAEDTFGAPSNHVMAETSIPVRELSLIFNFLPFFDGIGCYGDSNNVLFFALSVAIWEVSSRCLFGNE